MNIKENAKTGLYLNVKKTKTMTTEEIHNFNIDNADIETVKDLCVPWFGHRLKWRL